MTPEAKEKHRIYNREFMRRVRAEEQARNPKPIKNPRCQVCTAFINNEWHIKHPCISTQIAPQKVESV